MKKSILFILCAFFSIALIGMSSNKASSTIIAEQNNNHPTYYSLQLEGVFPKSDREKYENAFKSFEAPFVIDEIDYEKKIVIIKTTQKTTYDNIKQTFDKVGLRIIKEKIVKK